MSSKDIVRKPFFVRTGRTYVRTYVCTYVRTDVRTRVMLYAPPPIINGGGIIKTEGHHSIRIRGHLKSSIFTLEISTSVGFCVVLNVMSKIY